VGEKKHNLFFIDVHVEAFKKFTVKLGVNRGATCPAHCLERKESFLYINYKLEEQHHSRLLKKGGIKKCLAEEEDLHL
jgi:hypothetical protein